MNGCLFHVPTAKRTCSRRVSPRNSTHFRFTAPRRVPLNPMVDYNANSTEQQYSRWGLARVPHEYFPYELHALS